MNTSLSLRLLVAKSESYLFIYLFILLLPLGFVFSSGDVCELQSMSCVLMMMRETR